MSHTPLRPIPGQLPPFHAPSLNRRFIWQLELKVASKRGVANAVSRVIFVVCARVCVNVCMGVCVCIFYARLRFRMQINQRRPVTCRI